MQNSKMKKGLALALAASMVIGSSLTVFAEDTPGGQGGATGAGTSEGHVKKEVTNVVLPTDADTATFAYKMDPERLIQGTTAGKYEEGTVFPEAASDTGVYFLVGDKQYANTSKTLQVINKSSCNIKLTVGVKSTENTTNDITMATSSTVSTTAPELYLGLKVGNDTAKVVGATEVTTDKVIAGMASNFETAVENDAYVYREKADATTWKAMNICMEGAVSEKEIAADTTAPNVAVTWKWVKAADSDTPATDTVDYTVTPPAPEPAAPALTGESATFATTANTALEVGLSLGEGNLAATDITSVEFLNGSNVRKPVASADYSFADDVFTLSAAAVDSFRSSAQTTRDYIITFNDTDSTSVTITLTK